LRVVRVGNDPRDRVAGVRDNVAGLERECVRDVASRFFASQRLNDALISAAPAPAQAPAKLAAKLAVNDKYARGS
jgi:hypothetical protein